MRRSASSVTPNVLAVLTESTFLVEIEWLDQRMVYWYDSISLHPNYLKALEDPTDA